MKYRWLIPVGMAALAALLAFSLLRRDRATPHSVTVDRLDDLTYLRQALDLREDQAAEIAHLHRTLQRELDDCCVRHCATRARLGQALAAATNSEAAVEAILGELCQLYEESERATLTRVRAVRAVLDESQRKKFDALISACLCVGCKGNCGGDR